MENAPAHIKDLHQRYLANKLSPEEMAHFFSLIKEPGNEEVLKECMDNHWEYQFDGVVYTPVSQELLPTKRSVVLLWLRAVAAAALLLAVGTVVFKLVSKKPVEVLASQQERFKNDVQPGTNKAMLKLADGTLITLDSAQNSQLAIQGRAQVINNNGVVSYNNATAGSEKVLYNDMITPVGGQYKLTLADGTRVWLDASSSIHFPTSFPGSLREVEITGQAYFEVAKNAAKPFRVKVKEQVVEVLGTHFNINAYDNETGIRTTLVEGAVKTIQQGKTLLLKPGQQAYAEAQGGLQLVTSPDMEATLAWKNGLFHFDGAAIETIMKQVSRWYGVNIIYQNHPKEQFVAEIPRDVSLTRLLALLELTRQVHFKIEGNTITIL